MARWLLLAVLLGSALVRADVGVDAGALSGLDEPQIPLSEPPELLKQDAELDLGWSLFRTFIVLGMVVALAWLTLNVGLRKLLGLGPATGRRGLVSVLERVPLDQKRTLYVVKAGDEVLLLGGSDLSVNLISKLDPKVLSELAPTGQVLVSPFLQKLLGKKEAPPPAPPPAA